MTIVSAHRRCWFKSEHVTSISIVSPSTRFATLSQTGLKGIDRVRTDNSVDPEVPLGDSVGNAVSDVVERRAAEARMACSMESMRTYIAPIWRASSRAILVHATRGSPAKYSQHFLIMELQHNDLGGWAYPQGCPQVPVPVTPTASTC